MKNASLRTLLVCSPLLVAPPILAGPGTPAQTAARPSSQVRTTTLVARVEVVDSVATTTLVQTIVNAGARPAEATWLLPLPDGAVADDFRMTVDGVELAGEVLRADEATRVYESIVRRRRDPGLLEYAGRGCLRARVFPIPAGGAVQVEAGFRQVLPVSGGLFHYRLALAAAGVGGRAPEQVVLDLSVRSKRPIKNVFSPSGKVHVVAKGDHEVRASYENGAGPVEELDLFYGLAEGEFGLDLLSTRAAGAEEGSFLMLVAPKQDWSEKEISKKAITFVVDTSGSMQGQKIEQARGALRFFLGSLGPEDRFDVVPFSTEPEPFFGELVPATSANRERAQERVAGLRAHGGTNIDGALARALAFESVGPEFVPLVVFLTDGLPSVGVTHPPEILAGIRARNERRARVFVFGVGNDVNTHLLDTIAAESGGTRDYVREQEDIEVKTGALFTKLSHPVLTDLELSVEGVRLTRVVPAELPDLFRGSRLEVLGRYVGAGMQAIRLKGKVGGEPCEYVYEGTFADAAVDAHDFVPSLWAERRVGVLLDAMRLNGADPELVGEVRRLGTEHHIVTPYTSHLILEEGLRVAGAPGLFRGPGDTVPPGGGAGPASPGAARMSPGSASTGSDGFFIGRGTKMRSAPTLDAIVERLRAAGVLPAEATTAELEELAVEVAREMGAAREGLDDLGKEAVGTSAVDASQYLAALMSGGRGSESDSLLALFTRKVKDKVFVLRAGVWTDRDLDAGLDPATEPPRVRVAAFGDEYFALLRAQPRLAGYFAFSSRLVVLLDGTAYEVTPPPA